MTGQTLVENTKGTSQTGKDYVGDVIQNLIIKQDLPSGKKLLRTTIIGIPNN